MGECMSGIDSQTVWFPGLKVGMEDHIHPRKASYRTEDPTRGSVDLKTSQSPLLSKVI